MLFAKPPIKQSGKITSYQKTRLISGLFPPVLKGAITIMKYAFLALFLIFPMLATATPPQEANKIQAVAANNTNHKNWIATNERDTQ